MKLLQSRVRGSDHMCFGCSPANPIGLKLKFKMDGDLCRTEFEAGEEHQGWTGYMHGGLITALLDETMVWWLWLKDISIMTVEMNTRYSIGVPIKTKLVIESWCEEEKKGRLFLMAGRIVLPDGKVAVKASAKFMRVDPKQI
nr:PaaI family thioesterase [Desulfoscipio gibsoniae]